jgi:hypothetical protein
MVILITRNPSYLYVDVTGSARSVVDEATAKRVREALLAKFGERQYDEGLLTAVRLVRDKLAEQRP